MSDSLSVNDLNTDFLPLIYDIIRSYERDSHDISGLSQKALTIRDNQQSVNDSTAKIQTLKDRFIQFRQQINKIDGIGATKEEQMKSLDALKQQLVMKRDLLVKYKNCCPFDSNSKI